MTYDKIIVISAREEDQIFAGEVAKANAGQVLSGRTVDDVADEIAQGDFAAVLVDPSLTEYVLGDLEQVVEGQKSSNRIHAFVDKKVPDDLTKIIDHPIVGNFILRGTNDEGKFKDNFDHYGRILRASFRTQVNGIYDYFPTSTGVMTKNVLESLQKRYLADAVLAYLEKKNWHPKMASAVASALDELLMNAIFDAPVDASGNQVYQRVARSTAIKLDSTSIVEMQVAQEGPYLGITVTDNFGSLNRKRVLEHIAKAYSGESVGTRQEELEGAGLGLSLILRSGGSLVFAYNPGRRTEVSVFFRQMTSFPQFRNQFQFISIHQMETA